jgi:hypothetical protein
LRLSAVKTTFQIWHGTLIHGRSMGILLALLCGFTVAADHDQPPAAPLHAQAADQFSA